MTTFPPNPPESLDQRLSHACMTLNAVVGQARAALQHAQSAHEDVTQKNNSLYNYNVGLHRALEDQKKIASNQRSYIDRLEGHIQDKEEAIQQVSATTLAKKAKG